MSRYGRIWTVYRKELIETLRDRRTLIAMIVVPIVLYPVLMFVLMEVLKSESGRQEKQHYTICVPDDAHRVWLEGVLHREEAERAERRRADAQAAKVSGQEPADSAEVFRTEIGPDNITIEVAEPGRSVWDLVAGQTYHAGVIVDPPPDPDQFADSENRIVQILYSDTSPLSGVMGHQLDRILENEFGRIIRARVADLSQHDDILTPLWTNRLSTSSPDRQFAKVLGMLVPFFLVTVTVVGASYPAIDLTAGERERGTLETLAASPVPTGQIVAGKFGVIVTIAMATTTLNLASMSAVIHFSGMSNLITSSGSMTSGEVLAVEEMILAGGPTGEGAAALTQRENLERRRQLEQGSKENVGFIMTAAPVVLLSMVPFAVVFSAVMLAVCSFARTFKEAQYYITPVMMSAIMPALIVAYMPTIRLEGPLLVMPVANIVVLMRDLFLGNYDVTAITVCLLSTCLYAAAAITVAVRVHGAEAVLFSDVGSYKTLLLRKYLRPKMYPAAAFALLTVAIIFPLNFYVQSSLISVDAGGAHNLMVLAGTQLLLFALPVIFLAWYMKLDLRRTFSLRAPSLIAVVGATLLAVAAAPLANLLQQIQFSWFGVSQGTRALMEQQGALFGDPPLWCLLLAIAVIPGICEEVLFRGFLVAGLRERMSGLKVVLLVGLVFGLFHIYVEKILVVSLMGMLLTLVCLRSGSLVLAILVHVAHNGLLVAAGEFDRIRVLCNLPAGADDLGVVQFDVMMGVFVGLFVIGLALVAASANRIQRGRGEEASV